MNLSMKLPAVPTGRDGVSKRNSPKPTRLRSKELRRVRPAIHPCSTSYRIFWRRRIKTGLFFIFLFFLVSINSPVGRANEDKPSEASDTVSGQEKSGFNLGASIVSIFRDHISAVDGDRCPSVPTCSAYGVEAFQKHGFFKGWMMMVDRLIHEGEEETAVSPLIYSDGKWKIYDPVSNNDFWWYPPEKKPLE